MPNGAASLAGAPYDSIAKRDLDESTRLAMPASRNTSPSTSLVAINTISIGGRSMVA
jgi:hypothetical protein